MAIAILLVGIIFAIIYLYSITRDRWNWMNIIYTLLIPLLVIIMFSLFLTMKIFELQNIYFEIFLLFSGVLIFFLIKNLINKISNRKKNIANKFLMKYKKIVISLLIVLVGVFFFKYLENFGKEYNQKISLKREDSARECNAREIIRIEPILDKAFNSININSSFVDAKKVLEKISEESSKNEDNIIIPVFEGIPDNDIRSKYIYLDIFPDCDSSFHYQIQIIADENNKLLTYQTSAINPPKGYRWKGRLSFIPDNPPLIPVGLKEEEVKEGGLSYLPPRNFFAIWNLTADFKEQRREK